MARKSVFCIAQDDARATEIVQKLKDAGFQSDDISVLFPDKQGTRDFAHSQQTKAPEAAAAGAGTGGILGGALGWLAGIGALAIPGVGPFIAAGPIMAALSGLAVGAAVGGITGALVGMGIPEYEAKRYEGKIRSGNILISVHSDSSKGAEKARIIFEKAGAEDISTAGEGAVKAKAAGETTAGGAERAEAKPRSKKAGEENGRTNIPGIVTTPSAGATTTTTAPSGTRGRTAAPPVISAPPGATGQTTPVSGPTMEEISVRAYQIYLEKGSPEGRELENWLEAEAQLKAERRPTAQPSGRR
jgi:hypothetical protein